MLPDLDTATIQDTELITDPSLISEATLQAIQDRLSLGDLPRHVYTASLNVGGVAVADSFEKYLSADAYQSSHLKRALITPLHFHFSEDEDSKRLQELADREHFNVGTFIHQCVLEPTLFGRVIIEPKASLSTTEGANSLITFWKSLLADSDYLVTFQGEELPGALFIDCAQNAVVKSGLSLEKIDGKRELIALFRKHSGIIPVSEENFLKIKIIKKHLDAYADGIIFKLLRHSKREISFYHDRVDDSIKIKVRPDAIQFAENIGVNAIISLKSTAAEDLRSFYRHCAEYHYDLTEALYQDTISAVTGRTFDTTIMIMLQTVEPYAIAMLLWDREDLAVGRYKYQYAIESIRSAKQQGTYPGYESYADNPLGLICMKLPTWNGKELLPQLQT